VLMAGLSSTPPHQVAPLVPITCPAHSGSPAASACCRKALASACCASTLPSVMLPCSRCFVHCSSNMHTLVQNPTRTPTAAGCCSTSTSFCWSLLGNRELGAPLWTKLGVLHGHASSLHTTGRLHKQTAVPHGQQIAWIARGGKSNLTGHKHRFQGFACAGGSTSQTP
jgi:hypothetical protein